MASRQAVASSSELDEVMRELYDRLFMRYAEQHGKQRWGEKTPTYVQKMKLIQRAIEMIGVTPLPPARSSRSGPDVAAVKMPLGGSTRSSSPARTWSQSQLEA